MKYKTSVRGTKVGRRLWHGWPWCCWFLGRENRAFALFWGSRMRTKGYFAAVPGFIIQAAPLLLLLKSPQLAIGETPTNSLTVKGSWCSPSVLNNLALRCAIRKLGNLTGISRGVKTRTALICSLSFGTSPEVAVVHIGMKWFLEQMAVDILSGIGFKAVEFAVFFNAAVGLAFFLASNVPPQYLGRCIASASSNKKLRAVSEGLALDLEDQAR